MPVPGGLLQAQCVSHMRDPQTRLIPKWGTLDTTEAQECGACMRRIDIDSDSQTNLWSCSHSEGIVPHLQTVPLESLYLLHFPSVQFYIVKTLKETQKGEIIRNYLSNPHYNTLNSYSSTIIHSWWSKWWRVFSGLHGGQNTTCSCCAALVWKREV